MLTHSAKALIAKSLATLVLVSALTACSQDVHRFYSSIDRPTNVALYDPMTDKPLWEKQIPVGQTLELNFDRRNEREWQKVSLKPATEFSWKLFKDGNTKPVASDRLALPEIPVIMKVTYRPSPEYPSGYQR